MLFEYFKDTFIVRVILLDIRQLVAAGSERRGGCGFKQFKLRRIFFRKIVKIFAQYADNTVRGAIDMLDDVSVTKRFNEHTGCAGVNDGSRSSGLSKDQIAFQRVC